MPGCSLAEGGQYLPPSGGAVCFPPGVGPPLAVGRTQVLQAPLLEDRLELQRLDGTVNNFKIQETRIFEIMSCLKVKHIK